MRSRRFPGSSRDESASHCASRQFRSLTTLEGSVERRCREREVDPGVAIHAGSGHEIKLVHRDVAAVLVEDGQGPGSQHVVVNLLIGTAVLEDQGDGGL